jgi:hypothetical protein
LQTYTNLLNQQQEHQTDKIKITQNQALQMIFDLKFLYALFDVKSSSFSSGLNENPTLNKLYNRVLDSYKKRLLETNNILSFIPELFRVRLQRTVNDCALKHMLFVLCLCC